MLNENKDPTGREQSISLILNAPVEFVWDVWTKPEHIAHWWGPDGFTNSIQQMEVQTGGNWIFTMHGPDGRNYPNHTLFREVVQHKKLVHEHYNPNFIAIIEFERLGEKTFLKWYKLYETKALFEQVEKNNKSTEGFKQTIEKLNTYLNDRKKM